MQTDPAFNPVVAFGLEAVAMAFKAKCRALGRGDPGDLVRLQQRFVPTDDRARDAVAEFASVAVTDPCRAGARLLDFVLGWRAGRVSAGLFRCPVPDHSTWQDRKDCGHD